MTVKIFAKRGTVMRDVEELVLAGRNNDEIVAALPARDREYLVYAAWMARRRHELPLAGMARSRLKPRTAARSRGPATISAADTPGVPIAEIRRLHFERGLRDTEIAALLRVPYRAIAAAIGDM